MALAAPNAALAVPSRVRTFGASPKLLIAGSAIVLAAIYLIVVSMQSSTVYFLTVSELLARGPAASGQAYRVSGSLVPGTLVRGPNGEGISFEISDPEQPSRNLAVAYRGGQVPDIVGDNIEIVAEGKLDAQGSFQAATLLAKCPSRLENAPPDERDYVVPATAS
ncbi:MAG: cytochrome c maturation protein CcmE [Chloroflexi bacterium]|nr:cytochrome c maturation protein CcmE [Chloroflexota bacterium]